MGDQLLVISQLHLVMTHPQMSRILILILILILNLIQIRSLVQSQRIPRVNQIAATVITVSAATKKALVLKDGVSTRRMEGRSQNGARSLISSKTTTTRSTTARM